MFDLNYLKSEFNYRHDFDDSDLFILQERWQNVKFINIPTAWIILIDEMLCRMRYNNPILEIKQDFGRLFIKCNILNNKQKQIIEATENKILKIDKDLNDKIKNIEV